MVIYSDVLGRGGVLMQHGHVIGYASEQLKSHEELPTHDLEQAG